MSPAIHGFEQRQNRAFRPEQVRAVAVRLDLDDHLFDKPAAIFLLIANQDALRHHAKRRARLCDLSVIGTHHAVTTL
jgi:hypothetical protein